MTEWGAKRLWQHLNVFTLMLRGVDARVAWLLESFLKKENNQRRDKT